MRAINETVPRKIYFTLQNVWHNAAKNKLDNDQRKRPKPKRPSSSLRARLGVKSVLPPRPSLRLQTQTGSVLGCHHCHLRLLAFAICCKKSAGSLPDFRPLKHYPVRLLLLMPNRSLTHLMIRSCTSKNIVKSIPPGSKSNLARLNWMQKSKLMNDTTLADLMWQSVCRIHIQVNKLA